MRFWRPSSAPAKEVLTTTAQTLTPVAPNIPGYEWGYTGIFDRDNGGGFLTVRTVKGADRFFPPGVRETVRLLYTTTPALTHLSSRYAHRSISRAPRRPSGISTASSPPLATSLASASPE